MDMTKLKRQCGIKEVRVPGTLREFCGLSPKRIIGKKERHDNGPTTSQMLFVALTRKEVK